jgi:hypothetical protein
MIDFIAKARENRIIALSLHTNGSVMFFPEEDFAPSQMQVGASRRSVTHVSKPMFVRSEALKTSALIQKPNQDLVANDMAASAPSDVFVLTEEHAISEVMRLAA